MDVTPRVRVRIGSARAGIDACGILAQRFFDQGVTDAAIGAGHENDFVGKHHNTEIDTAPTTHWALMGRPVLAPAGVDTRMMIADDAFRALTEPYRHELKVHCYRMLGSVQDAEDALQDSFLTAWRHLDGFEARASIRTWLYKIATNRCLNALRTASRRPAIAWNIPGIDEPEASGYGEVPWLEPFPDAQSGGASEVVLGPEARYEQSESISLAFITALQLLPPRQLAVLILRDVLGYHAHEVAEMLDATLDSVNSALKTSTRRTRTSPLIERVRAAPCA